ncbi:MAG: NADP-dependent oxidoreductase [Rhodovibrionaceae bacterium]
MTQAKNGGGNRQIVLAARPDPAVSESCFRLEEAARPSPGEGELLTRALYLSIDPAMRGWIAAGPNYSEPVALGAPMRSLALSQVIESRHPDYAAGELVYRWQGWQDYALSDGGDIDLKVDADALHKAGAPLSAACHLLGITGLTGYLGLTLIGAPQPGETVAVSTAAGGVGSVVGQAAKNLACRTLGLTGSDDKVKTCLEEFGYDAAINYKSAEDLDAAVAAAAPQGIDIYFDNTGGAISDAVMPHLNLGARVVVCGTMGIAGKAEGPRYNRHILVKRAKMQGFLIFDHKARFAAATQTLLSWIAEGRLTGREDITEGLENAPQALLRLLAGGNRGKMLVKLAEQARA